MTALKIVCGIIFLLLSFGYLYQPRIILRFNAFFRNYLFNDRFLLERWKLGVFFLLLSLIAFYMGLSALFRERERHTPLPAAKEQILPKK